ncbi:hypothetical protein [Marinobacterium mangrovicola]|nr:hypothetical protein [Marinobacterium mangrovicola]
MRLVRTGLLWDLIGYVLVLSLVVYLSAAHLGLLNEVSKPSKTADLGVRNGEYFETLAGNESEALKDQKQPFSRDTVQRAYRSVDRVAPDLLLERLELLQSRPAWTLLDIDAAQAKRDLWQLIREGDAALPAIAHFLARGADADFTKGGIDDEVGYPSLRLALFAALERIGGHQVESILYEELHKTQQPTEIEALGFYLNDASPGLYDQDIVRAARDVFSTLVNEGGGDRDTGPLFRIFSQYGDASISRELEGINQLNWGRYAAITLSELPDGGGVQALSNRVYGADRSDAGAQFAIKILAQSSEYPAAANALINSVRASLIPDRRWSELSRLIAGTYHLQLTSSDLGSTASDDRDIRSPVLKTNQYISRTPGGGQVVYGLEFASPVLAPDQILPRMELIDQLLFEVTSPVAKRELEKAYETLWLLNLEQEK